MTYYFCLALIFVLNTVCTHAENKAKWGLIHNLTLPEVTLDEEAISKRVELLKAAQVQQVREGFIGRILKKIRECFSLSTLCIDYRTMTKQKYLVSLHTQTIFTPEMISFTLTMTGGSCTAAQ